MTTFVPSLVRDDGGRWSRAVVVVGTEVERTGVGESTAPTRRPTIAKHMAASKSGRPRGNPAWTPGCPSPNPRGRPRTGLAAAEKIRERVDPDDWISFELGVAMDVKLSIAERRAAWHALIDRGFVKPATAHDLNVSRGDGASYDLSALTDEQLAERLAWLRGRRELGEGTPAEPDQDPTTGG